MGAVTNARQIVFVEGPSDKAAIEALARRLGRDLVGEKVDVVAIGGAHALGRHLGKVPPDIPIAGLYDIGEIGAIGRALERFGVASSETREQLETLGFYVCDPDLEGELIGALGAHGVEAVLESSGKLTAFRTFQKQPQWRGRQVEDQLRRFFGSSAGKARHAPLMVDELDLDRIPPPLAGLLERVASARERL